MADTFEKILKLGLDKSSADRGLDDIERKMKSLQEKSIIAPKTERQLDALVAGMKGLLDIMTKIGQIQVDLTPFSDKKKDRLKQTLSKYKSEATVSMRSALKEEDEAAISTAAEGAAEKKGASKGSSVYAEAAKRFADMMKKAINAVSAYFKEQFMTAFKELLSTSGIGSFATSSSLFSNAAARTQQMAFGLTEAQNYAMTQTMKTLGMSQEDLFWMNENQLDAFRQLTSMFESQFETLNQNGGLLAMQQMAVEFAAYRAEIGASVMKFIIDNREDILAALKVGLIVLKVIGQAVIKILSFFGKMIDVDTSALELSDSYSEGGSSTNNTSNNNATINVTVNGNGNGKEIASEIEKAYRTQMIKTLR